MKSNSLQRGGTNLLARELQRTCGASEIGYVLSALHYKLFSKGLCAVMIGVQELSKIYGKGLELYDQGLLPWTRWPPSSLLENKHRMEVPSTDWPGFI